jgi:F-type H+-transporting ATPase subunit epsilon
MGIQLDIVTTSAIAHSGEVAEIQAPGVLGEFGVLPDHAAMLAATKAGVVTLHVSGEAPTRMLVGPGFAEVGESSVTLLVDSCEDVAGIDKEAAAKDLAAAESILGAGDPATAEYTKAQVDAEMARARLDA